MAARKLPAVVVAACSIDLLIANRGNLHGGVARTVIYGFSCWLKRDIRVANSREQPGKMAQQGSATLKGNAVELQMAFQEKGYPVAFVGSDVDDNYEKLHIFKVLEELKLARRIGPIPDRGSKEEKEAKAKDKDGLKTNLFQDKKGTKSVYEVDDRPSVIISITGDAADLPEDHELEEAVASLTGFCGTETLNKFVLSSEAAHRAILANYVYREDQIKKNYIDVEEHKAKLESFTKVKCMQISYLLEIRIQELGGSRQGVTEEIKPKIQLLSKCFKYASVRDVLLDITKKLEDNVSRLWSGDFNFPELKETKSASNGEDCNTEPISSGKRLSKSR